MFCINYHKHKDLINIQTINIPRLPNKQKSINLNLPLYTISNTPPPSSIQPFLYNIDIPMPIIIVQHNSIFNYNLKVYMNNNSLSTLPSSFQLNNQQHTDHPAAYYNITLNQTNYRVLIQEYKHHRTAIDIYLISSLGIVFICVFLLINKLIQIGIILPMTAVTLASMALCCLVIVKRKEIHPCIIFTILLFTIYIASATTLFGLALKYLSYATSIYIGLQLAHSLILIDKKGILFAKILSLVQLLLIALKLDLKIASDWSAVMCIALVTQMFMMGALLFMSVYTLIITIWFQEHRSDIRERGFLFIVIVLTCFVFLLAVPLMQVYFGSLSVVQIILTIICHVSAAVFSYLNRTYISVFLCNSTAATAEVAPLKNQKIQKIPGGVMTLYRMSQNWFIKAGQQKECTMSGNSDAAMKRQECLICLSEDSTMVWMPCGHLSTCQKCCCYLIEQAKFNCILCKSRTDTIFKIKLQGNVTNMNTEMLCSSNQYGVQYYFNVNS